MRLDLPIDDIFLNRSHVRVLRALHHLPEGLSVSGREIARRAAVTHPTALKALALLVDVGVVSVSRTPASDAYELRPSHFFASHLESLFRAEDDIKESLVSFLAKELLSRTKKVEWATLFGSAVWGQSTPTSDIDIAVSCSPRDADEVGTALNGLSDATQRQFGNRVIPLVSTQRHRPKSGVWKRIEEEGIALIRAGRAT